MLKVKKEEINNLIQYVSYLVDWYGMSKVGYGCLLIKDKFGKNAMLKLKNFLEVNEYMAGAELSSLHCFRGVGQQESKVRHEVYSEILERLKKAKKEMEKEEQKNAVEVPKEQLLKAYKNGSPGLRKTLKDLYPDIDFEAIDTEYADLGKGLTHDGKSSLPFIGFFSAPPELMNKCIMAERKLYDIELMEDGAYHIIAFKKKKQ